LDTDLVLPPPALSPNPNGRPPPQICSHKPRSERDVDQEEWTILRALELEQAAAELEQAEAVVTAARGTSQTFVFCG
jgi:hypothetical protein